MISATAKVIAASASAPRAVAKPEGRHVLRIDRVCRWCRQPRRSPCQAAFTPVTRGVLLAGDVLRARQVIDIRVHGRAENSLTVLSGMPLWVWV